MVTAGDRVGHYRLLQRIGAGGMGEVFLAADCRVDRRVALKLLNPDRADGLARFHNEARLHARLFHGHIARLFGFVTDNDPPYLVMEYLGGPTLAEWIVAAGPAPHRQRLQLFAGIADAIAYLHDHGVLHRDIKPTNIRLAADGRAKLLDFGIARDRETPALTKAGHVIGTIRYLAPELLRGAPPSPASDVWALGAVLHELLTGRPPFPGNSAGALIKAVESGHYPSPATQVAGLPAVIDQLLREVLAPAPDERLASGRVVVDRLRHGLASLTEAPTPRPLTAGVIDGEGEEAAASGVLGRLRRLSRRSGW